MEPDNTNGAEPMSIDVEPSLLPEKQAVGDDSSIAIIDPDVDLADEPVEAKPRADDPQAMKNLIYVEDPHLEVECETTFTWDITNWRKMERRTHSPTFMCGDTPWRILFFPFGNNCDCASFYLEHGFEDKPPENWYQCVQFGLVLSNPNDPTCFVHHQAHHRFTPEEGDWGFTRFVELRDLVQTSEKRPHALVENDCAKVTAYVRVLKDPTGVLWHNFVNYDSKKETGYVGIKNQGATCYLNSLLQSLYFTNNFRKAVYKIPTESEDLGNSALTLQRLFYLLQTAPDAVPTLELTKSFGWETQDIFAQQDIQELSRILMENLENKMKGTEVENSLGKIFVGKTKTYIKCINVDYKSERIEEFWDIQMNVRGYKNLHDSFMNYIAMETMEGENKYFAEGHGLQDARKGVSFEAFPEVLHLHLKRFEYDLATYALHKVNDHYEFPESFDAGQYLSADADRSSSWEYVLHGVLVHSGDLNAGHYYAFLKPEKDGEFFKFDDDRVTKALKREALEENFGGEYSVHDGGRNPHSRQVSMKRAMNAYMLVYFRKNKIDEILCPVTQDDTPPHLAMRLEEERKTREQRKRDREEQHLYLQVRIIAESQFKAHQGFDLANWDDKDAPPEAQPVPFKFKKAAKMRELVEDVAKRVDAHPEQIRLWVMVNRQNKTVRPDQPLIDLDKTVEDMQVKHNSKSNDLRLWVEYNEKPKEMIWLKEPCTQSPWIVVFIKQFDAQNQTLKGVGHAHMRKNDRVQEIMPAICDIAKIPHRTDLILFEEIKPTMIEPIKGKQTFQQAEIQDGDIICFQVPLDPAELEFIKEKKLPKDPKEFYDKLVNLVAIRFLPKNKQQREFVLPLSKKNTYDEVAEKVGAQLGVPPTHLRFMTVNASNSLPRSIIKRTPTMQLTNMVTPQYYTTSPISTSQLIYEVLEMSLAELETKKTIKFVWLPEGVAKEEATEYLVPKNGTVEDLIPHLLKKFNVSEQAAATRLRFFIAHQGKFQKEIPHNFGAAGIQDFTTLYAELVPQEELDADLEVCRMIEAFHFQKEPSKTHIQGVPFKFVVKKGERFEDTKARLQARTGIKGKPFEKIKFAVIKKSNYSKPTYLTDDDILFDLAEEEGDMLGLDHVDRNGRNGWGRVGGPEIRIK